MNNMNAKLSSFPNIFVSMLTYRLRIPYYEILSDFVHCWANTCMQHSMPSVEHWRFLKWVRKWILFFHLRQLIFREHFQGRDYFSGENGKLNLFPGQSSIFSVYKLKKCTYERTPVIYQHNVHKMDGPTSRKPWYQIQWIVVSHLHHFFFCFIQNSGSYSTVFSLELVHFFALPDEYFFTCWTKVLLAKQTFH